MKKNDLIKVLENISGNPDVIFWNGLVDDFQEIDSKFVSVEFFKEKINSLHECLENEWCSKHKSADIPEDVSNDLLNKAKQMYRNSKFEHMDYINHEKFIKKRCVVIQPQLTGKTYYDRIGNIKY